MNSTATFVACTPACSRPNASAGCRFESCGRATECPSPALRPWTGLSSCTLCFVAEGAFAAAGPPVPVAEDAHGGRHEQNADDRRVHENGHGEAEADGFGNDDAAKGERAGHDDDNGGG